MRVKRDTGGTFRVDGEKSSDFLPDPNGADSIFLYYHNGQTAEDVVVGQLDEP